MEVFLKNQQTTATSQVYSFIIMPLHSAAPSCGHCTIKKEAYPIRSERAAPTVVQLTQANKRPIIANGTESQSHPITLMFNFAIIPFLRLKFVIFPLSSGSTSAIMWDIGMIFWIMRDIYSSHAVATLALDVDLGRCPGGRMRPGLIIGCYAAPYTRHGTPAVRLHFAATVPDTQHLAGAHGNAADHG
jgi:hypothetical protein